MLDNGSESQSPKLAKLVKGQRLPDNSAIYEKLRELEARIVALESK